MNMRYLCGVHEGLGDHRQGLRGAIRHHQAAGADPRQQQRHPVAEKRRGLHQKALSA